MKSKEELRKEGLLKRKSVDIMILSKKISIKFLNSELYQTNEIIMSYNSFGSEVDTSLINKTILEDKKTLLLPVVHENRIVVHKTSENDSFKASKFGIMEPVQINEFDMNKIELVLVPGIVFDTSGYRIGFGKGYYDGFLKDMNCLKVGLAFEIQLVELIPFKSHDIRMDGIITEKDIVMFKNKNQLRM